VAVTSGLVDALDKRELEAVVAHEISHIKHNDVGRAVQQAAMLSGLTAAFRAGRHVMQEKSNDSKKSAGAAVAGRVEGVAMPRHASIEGAPPPGRRGRRAVDGRGRAAPARVLALRGIRRGRRGRAHGRPRGALARAGED